MKCIHCNKEIGYLDYRVGFCKESPDTMHHLEKENLKYQEFLTSVFKEIRDRERCKN